MGLVIWYVKCKYYEKEKVEKLWELEMERRKREILVHSSFYFVNYLVFLVLIFELQILNWKRDW